jgi:hypothetical protein
VEGAKINVRGLNPEFGNSNEMRRRILDGELSKESCSQVHPSHETQSGFLYSCGCIVVGYMGTISYAVPSWGTSCT